MIYRLSTTTLDAWHKYITDVQKFGYSLISDDSMIQTIKRIGEFGEKPFYGTLFHSILEDSNNLSSSDWMLINDIWHYSNIAYTDKTIKYKLQDLQECIMSVPELYKGSDEVKIAKSYKVDGETIYIVAKADKLYGTSVIEYKTQYGDKPSDFIHNETPEYDRDTYEEYFHSLQWKCYLDIFEGAEEVKYYIFQFLNNYVEPDEEGKIVKPNSSEVNLDLFKINQSIFHPYENMHDEIVEELRDFIRFVKEKDLMSYLEYDEKTKRYLR